MRRFSRYLGCLTTALLIVAGCGDSKTDEETKTKSPPVVKSKTTDDGGKGTKTEVALPAKPEPEIAKVVLSAEEAATCLVMPGDAFPDAKLKNAAGGEQLLSQQTGELATVIVLWTNQGRRGGGRQITRGPGDVRG